jgi:enoyl-CoA hydratase/carnithine racemase
MATQLRPRHGVRQSAKRFLSLRVADGVAWLCLERPRAGNRVTQDLAQAVCDAAEEIEDDERARIVVLSAVGPRFCLGVEDGGDWEQRVDWVEAIARLTRPVVAAVQGDAVAEGFELALACDLRVVSSRACFAMPQLAQGRLPVHGGTQRLPRIAGRSRALDLLLTGRAMDAPEAAEMGIATCVAPPRSFRKAVAAVVDDLLAKGPIALRYAKEAVLKGTDLTLEQGVRLEEDLYVLLQTTRDRREGVRAFLGKRKPTFQGR